MESKCFIAKNTNVYFYRKLKIYTIIHIHISHLSVIKRTRNIEASNTLKVYRTEKHSGQLSWKIIRFFDWIDFYSMDVSIFYYTFMVFRTIIFILWFYGISLQWCMWYILNEATARHIIHVNLELLGEWIGIRLRFLYIYLLTQNLESNKISMTNKWYLMKIFHFGVANDHLFFIIIQNQ